MNTCGKCGREELSMQPIHRYQLKKELMGGMHVELIDVVNGLVCDRCKEISRTDIPDMSAFIAAVAVARTAKEPLRLSGSELRFLRKAIGKSAKELAQELRVSEETVSRWENGHALMGEPIERIFRWTVCDALGEKAPGVDWNHDEILKKMNIVSVSAQPLAMYFQRTGQKRKGRQQLPRYEQRQAA